MSFPILTSILLCPVIGLFLVLLTPPQQENTVRVISLVSAFASLVLSLLLCFHFDVKNPAFQFVEHVEWVKSYGIHYTNGVDGLNIWMILLTAILIFLVVGVFGVFMTTNLFFFFLFYEIAVIPMYLLIVVWGSTDKEYAAMKLTLYLLFGSALMFAGFLYMYSLPDARTFDLVALKQEIE